MASQLHAQKNTERIEVKHLSATIADQLISMGLDHRVAKHGALSYISAHESLGIITEEFDELKDAVRSNSKNQVQHELIDIAVACVWALASMHAHGQLE